MKKVLTALICCVTISSIDAGAGSLFGDIKEKYQIAKCLAKKTQGMCLLEFIYKDGKKSPLKKDNAVQGRSRKYSISAPNANWLKLQPSKIREGEDLQLMDKSQHALLQVGWTKGKADYDMIAQESVKDLTKNIKDHRAELDFWPYNKAGSIYEVCYKTKKKTEECMFSAAAQIKGGVISFFALTASDDKLIEDIVYIMTSIQQK